MKLILILSIIIQSSFAINLSDAMKGKVSLKSVNTPIEYRLVVDSLNSYDLSDKEKEQLLTDIITSDTYFSHIPKTELFILCITEIYKLILSFPDKSSNYKRDINQDLINSLELKSKSKELNPMGKWIMKAVIKDLELIINYKYFQTYQIQKAQNKKLSTIELIKIDKKVNLLTPWINIFLQNEAEQINILLRPLHFKVINRIAYLSKIIFVTSSFEDLPTPSTLKNLSFFQYSRDLTKSESDMKKIDDVIGNISLFPTTSDQYQKPKDLPDPKNDWVPKDDLDKLRQPKVDLFPSPDPNYVRPNNLPEPVNDWLLDL
jgi:hypothetical protein